MIELIGCQFVCVFNLVEIDPPNNDVVHDALAASSFAQTFMEKAPEDDLGQEVTDALEMNSNGIAPIGKGDTAKALQDHTAKTQDILVDTVENAEVAEIKRAAFRALTRLRAATIKEFDAIARLETQDIDAYNDAHHHRAENPLTHLHEDETDMLKPFEMGLKLSWARKWQRPRLRRSSHRRNVRS